MDLHRATLERNREKLLDGMAAGFLATLVMSAVALAAPRLGGARVAGTVDGAIAQLRALGGGPLLALVAFAAHLGYGTLAGGLFAVGARRISPGRGVLFALGLWAVAGLVYAPLVGLGPLAWHVPGLAAVALPLHVLYGLALGALAPRGEITQVLESRAAGSHA